MDITQHENYQYEMKYILKSLAEVKLRPTVNNILVLEADIKKFNKEMKKLTY